MGTAQVTNKVDYVKPRLLIVANVDWFFLSHRLPVALGALKSGYEVHVAASLTEPIERMQSYGFIVHSIEMDRSAAGAWSSVTLFFRLLRLFQSVKPSVLHLVTIKPVLFGGLAARLAGVRGVVYAISGLGHVFVAQGVLGALRRAVVRSWYRLVLGAANMRVIFQNRDDLRELQSVAPLQAHQVVMIPGSGVDLSVYAETPQPSGVPVVLMASRLLETKGVREFVRAAEILQAAGVQAQFRLVGDTDPDNPASVSEQDVLAWKHAGVVEVLGHRSDMPTLMAQAHMVVLPSYREGFPKVLIEAAACGRAIITTDVPGCRDAVLPGITGLLVPPRNAEALAHAIQRLVDNPAACAQMGRAGRLYAEKTFDIAEVVATHINVYRQLVAAP